MTINYSIPVESELIQAPHRRRHVQAVIYNNSLELDYLKRLETLKPDKELFEKLRYTKLNRLLNNLLDVEYIVIAYKGDLQNEWSQQKLQIERELNPTK